MHYEAKKSKSRDSEDGLNWKMVCFNCLGHNLRFYKNNAGTYALNDQYMNLIL